MQENRQTTEKVDYRKGLRNFNQESDRSKTCFLTQSKQKRVIGEVPLLAYFRLILPNNDGFQHSKVETVACLCYWSKHISTKIP